MIKTILALVALVVIASAQNTPQTGPLNIVTLNNTLTVQSFALPIQPTELTAYHLNLYKFWVPANTSTVVIVVNNTYPVDNEDSCYDLNLYISSNGYVPCSPEEYDDDSFYCANAQSTYATNYDDATVFDLSPSDLEYDEDNFIWSVNRWWYFGVGREEYDDYANACTYTVQIYVNSSCAVGSIAQSVGFDGFGDSDVQCSPPTIYQNTSSATYNFSGSTNVVYEVAVPSYTVGSISITVNSVIDSLYIAGSSYSSPEEDENACFTDSEGEANAQGVYTYTLTCYTPRIGSFFVTVFQYDEETGNINGTIKISYTDCNSTTSGLGGYNCSFPVVPCNTTWNNFGVYIPYPTSEDDSWLNGKFWYCYIDINANSTIGSYNAFVTIPTGSATDSYEFYYIIRKNGFPEYDSSYGYDAGTEAAHDDLVIGDTEQIGLNVFDFYEQGRWYISFFCEEDGSTSNTGCNFTITANSTVGPVSTGTSGNSGTSNTGTSTANTGTTSTKGTSTSTTATMSPTMVMTTSGGKTSSAAIVLPSLFVAAASMIALLF